MQLRLQFLIPLRFTAWNYFSWAERSQINYQHQYCIFRSFRGSNPRIYGVKDGRRFPPAKVLVTRIIFLYKIVNNLKNNSTFWNQSPLCTSRTLRNNKLFYLLQVHANVTKNLQLFRLCKLANNFPAIHIFSTYLKIFKNECFKCNLTILWLKVPFSGTHFLWKIALYNYHYCLWKYLDLHFVTGVCGWAQ